MPFMMADAISKSYGGRPVLRDVSLRIEAGEFVSLLGASGCGKSTLLRIIAGLETPDGGALHVDGKDVTGLSARERDTAMIFQSYALYPNLTVEQNIALPLRMRRLTAFERLPLAWRLSAASRARHTAIKAEVEAVAQMLRLGEHMAHKPAMLSGGQRQRVAIGRAIVRHPSLFLMDEPLSNLDAELRLRMRAELVALHRRLGTTTLYVTHDQVEAMTMSDRIAVLVDGQVRQFGRPRELYENPADKTVATLVGSPSIRFVSATVADGRLVLAGRHVLPAKCVLPAGTGAIEVGIRPDAATHADAAAPDAVTMQVVDRQDLGGDIFVKLQARDDTTPLAMRWRGDAGELPDLGARIPICFDVRKLLLFDAQGHRLPDPVSIADGDA